MAKQTQFQEFLLLFVESSDGVSEQDFIESGKSRATWFRYLDQAKLNHIHLIKGENKKYQPADAKEFSAAIKDLVSTSDFIKPSLTTCIIEEAIPVLKKYSLELQNFLNYDAVFTQAQDFLEAHEAKLFQSYQTQFKITGNDFTQLYTKILLEQEIKHGALLQSIQDFKGMTRNWHQSLKTSMHQNRYVNIQYVDKTTITIVDAKIAITDIATYGGGYLKFITTAHPEDSSISILLSDITFIDVTQDKIEFTFEKYFHHSEKSSPSFQYTSPLKVIKEKKNQLIQLELASNTEIAQQVELHSDYIQLKFQAPLWRKFRLETWPYTIADTELEDGSGIREIGRIETDIIEKLRPYQKGIEILKGQINWD